MERWKRWRNKILDSKEQVWLWPKYQSERGIWAVSKLKNGLKSGKSDKSILQKKKEVETNSAEDVVLMRQIIIYKSIAVAAA